MLRTFLLAVCFGLFGLTLSGCGQAKTELSGPVSQDAVKVAQEEEKKVQDAEMAEQQKALQATY